MDMLTADIGGTSSRFFLFSYNDKVLRIKEGITLSSSFETFEALLEKLFTCWPGGGERLLRVDMAVFAAAGPVRNGSISMTNARFSVEINRIRSIFPGAGVLLMNDFEAQAWACLSPAFEEARLLLPGHGAYPPGKSGFGELSGLEASGAPLAVVGAGTGVGAAWLIPGERAWHAPFVLPSEAGHIPFPFEGEEEQNIADFFAASRGVTPVTAEHVLSGSGLAYLYEYFEGRKEEPKIFTCEPGFESSRCCGVYARFYGRFCRMVALSLLPQALIVTGGVAGRTPVLVRHPEFSREFLRAAGEQNAFLGSVPVWLNTHAASGLWGAARAGALFVEREHMK